MARLTFSMGVGGTVIGKELFTEPHGDVDPVNASTTAADITTLTAADTLALTTDKAVVDANIATLVADGATPTQAHVTTLNTNWTTMKTDMVALHAAIAALQADLAGRPVKTDVVVSIDLATVPSRSILRRALQRIGAAVESTNALTA